MERNIKKMGTAKKYNGVPIFSAATVFLFLAVFIMSSVARSGIVSDKDADDKKLGKDDKTQISEQSDNNAGGTAAGNKPSLPAPVADPAEADNTWAMFLVNSVNPLTEKYCNGIELEKVYSSWRDYYMDTRAAKAMTDMIDAAAEDDIQLVVLSAHRTIRYQQENFDRSVQERIDNGMTYDEAYADTLKEVQLPGYSEHNAGLAADIMSDEYSSMDDDGFRNTDAYEWLIEHCAEYGFILRYPEGKDSYTGIIYEPWHYRYVGKYYAKLIMDEGICLEELFIRNNWVDGDGRAVYHLPDGMTAEDLKPKTDNEAADDTDEDAEAAEPDADDSSDDDDEENDTEDE